MSGADTVEVVELAGRRVVFLSRQPLPLGTTCWVRMAVRDTEGWLHIQPVPVILECNRNIQEGQTACVGSLAQEEFLEPVLSCASIPGRNRRDPRQPCRLRVLAPELGVEGAWAVDFSQSGIQVSTRQPLEPGSLVRLHLYPSDSVCTSLPVNARVAWCRSHPEEGCRAGLEFRDLPAYLRKELRLLHEQLGKPG